MREHIGRMRKFRDNFQNQKIITGISPSEWKNLSLSFFQAVQKKIGKDYSQFSNLSNLEPLGILLVCFVDEDPFFMPEEFEQFINQVKDEHIFDSLKLGDSQFCQIFFGAYINTVTGVYLHYISVVNLPMMLRVMLRFERKKQYCIDSFRSYV